MFRDALNLVRYDDRMVMHWVMTNVDRGELHGQNELKLLREY